MDGVTGSDASGTESGRKPISKIVVVCIVISVVILIGVGLMYYFGDREPVVVLFNDHMQIRAMYGLRVDFDDVSNVSLIEGDLRNIGVGNRTNGYSGFSGIWKGNFDTWDFGVALFFVQSRGTPTIHIKRDDAKDIFVNFSDSEETMTLFYNLDLALRRFRGPFT